MIKYIQILGERYSGTNYLSALITANMPRVEVTKSFGGKHWFLKDHFPRCRPNNSTDYQCLRSLNDSDDTLFLIILRNPFDWLRSLIVNPYHAEGHLGLPFSRFIREPWISFEKKRINEKWPANVKGNYFIEEAENVLALRTTKMLHWMNLRKRVRNISFINYERLRGDVSMLSEIADSHSIVLASREIIDETRYCCGGVVRPEEYTPKSYDPILKDDLLFIKHKLDWRVEQDFNYRFDDYQVKENRMQEIAY